MPAKQQRAYPRGSPQAAPVLDNRRNDVTGSRTFAREEMVDVISLTVGRNKLCHRLAVLGYDYSLFLSLNLVHNGEAFSLKGSCRHPFHRDPPLCDHGHYTMVISATPAMADGQLW